MAITRLESVGHTIRDAVQQPVARVTAQVGSPGSALATLDSAVTSIRQSASALQDASQVVLFPSNDAENMVSGGVTLAAGVAAIGFAISKRSPVALAVGLAAGGALAVAGSARLKEAFDGTFGTISSTLSL